MSVLSVINYSKCKMQCNFIIYMLSFWGSLVKISRLVVESNTGIRNGERSSL